MSTLKEWPPARVCVMTATSNHEHRADCGPACAHAVAQQLLLQAPEAIVQEQSRGATCVLLLLFMPIHKRSDMKCYQNVLQLSQD